MLMITRIDITSRQLMFMLISLTQELDLLIMISKMAQETPEFAAAMMLSVDNLLMALIVTVMALM
jgi:hypothetical protein